MIRFGMPFYKQMAKNKLLRFFREHRLISISIPILVMLFILGFFLVTGMPEYAIMRIEKSFTRHNWESFNEYVAMDTLMNAAYDDFVYTQSLKEVEDTSEKSFTMASIMLLMKPQALPVLTKELQYFIEHGSFENYEKTKDSDVSLAAYRKTFNEHSRYIGFDKKKIDDKTLLFNFRFETEHCGALSGKKVSLEILMKKTSHHWTMHKIQNLKELLVLLDQIKNQSSVRKSA